MSEENVQTIELIIEAWNRRDSDALLSFADPDAVYINQPEAVEPGTRHGLEGLIDVARKQWEALGPDGRLEIETVYPRGDEVITAGRVSRTIPGSTSRLDNRVVQRWHFRDGALISLEILGAGPTFKQALEAAGVTE